MCVISIWSVACWCPSVDPTSRTPEMLGKGVSRGLENAWSQSVRPMQHTTPEWKLLASLALMFCGFGILAATLPDVMLVLIAGVIAVTAARNSQLDRWEWQWVGCWSLLPWLYCGTTFLMSEDALEQWAATYVNLRWLATSCAAAMGVVHSQLLSIPLRLRAASAALVAVEMWVVFVLRGVEQQVGVPVCLAFMLCFVAGLFVFGGARTVSLSQLRCGDLGQLDSIPYQTKALSSSHESFTDLQLSRFWPLSPLLASKSVIITPGSVAEQAALHQAVIRHHSMARGATPSNRSVASTSDFLTGNRSVAHARAELKRFRVQHHQLKIMLLLKCGSRDPGSLLWGLDEDVLVCIFRHVLDDCTQHRSYISVPSSIGAESPVRSLWSAVRSRGWPPLVRQ